MSPKTKSLAVPESMLPTYTAITALTDAFCHELLNDEYCLLCREMAASLARKRPSPLAPGHWSVEKLGMWNLIHCWLGQFFI